MRSRILSSLLFSAVLGLTLQGCGNGSRGGIFSGNGGNNLGDGFLGPWGGAGAGTGSGNGTGNGAGTGTGGYKGPLGDVTFNYLSGTEPGPGLDDLHEPFKFQFKGPTQIVNLECIQYSLSVVNKLGLEVAVPIAQTIAASLQDDGTGVNTGGFFSDAGCRQGIATFEFKAGETRKTFYYMSGTARGALLKADARYKDGDIIGRYGINIGNNPKLVVEFGINYEDLPSGDFDYNDVVICDRKSQIYESGGKVKSFANSRITLDVSSTSACTNYFRVLVTDSETRQTTTSQEYNSKTASSVSFDVKFGDEIQFQFGANPSQCFAKWVPNTNAQQVRMTNKCRGPSDEFQRWN